MTAIRQRLWPRNRLAVAILLYVIWIPTIIVLAGNDWDDSGLPAATQTESVRDDGPDDFAEAVGWTWGILWIGYAALAGWLAMIKGRSPIRWGFASLLTFIALFPFLAVAPELKRD